MKQSGTISDGPYAGQQYYGVQRSPFMGWVEVQMTDENGKTANREVREENLEKEAAA